MPEYKVVDVDKVEIVVGTRVLCLGYPSASGGVPDALATVDHISDPDDDDPKVHVIYDEDGEAEDYNTYWLGNPNDEDAPYMCDDVRVVEAL